MPQEPDQSNTPKSAATEGEGSGALNFFVALLLECARRAERDADYNARASCHWQREHLALAERERKSNHWLEEAKRARGYPWTASFDQVWAETCATADADKARLDWLEMQCVKVRTPLVYGSRENFRANPDDSYEGEIGPSDLRDKIDAALANTHPTKLTAPDGEGRS